MRSMYFYPSYKKGLRNKKNSYSLIAALEMVDVCRGAWPCKSCTSILTSPLRTMLVWIVLFVFIFISIACRNFAFF